MSNTYASQAKSRQLADLLRIELAATLPVCTESFDTDGNPVITLSADATPAFGEKVIVIRTKPIDWPTAKDSLGNAAVSFGPHVYQICTEANFAGTTDNVADILTMGEKLMVIVEVGRCGSFVEYYESANGTVPSTAQMTAGNLKGTWRDLYFNILKSS